MKMAINNSKNMEEWLSIYGRANFAGNKLTYMKACSLHSEIYFTSVLFPIKLHFFSRNKILNSLSSKYLKSITLLSAFNRSTVSSKASSPQSAIYCFLFQFMVNSPFLNVILLLLRSFSSFSRNFYPSLYITFNNVIQLTATKENSLSDPQ